MSNGQLNFVFVQGSTDQTSNPLSVVNAHIATHGHRKRRQAGAIIPRRVRIGSQKQHVQKARKSPLPERSASNIAFIHCTFPTPLSRALLSRSASSTGSSDGQVDKVSEQSSSSWSTESDSLEEIVAPSDRHHAEYPPDNSAGDLRVPHLSILSTNSSRVILSSSSIGWLDPFNNFPIKLARQDHLLLHHYKFAIPSTIFGIHRSETYSIQKNLFFPIAMREKTWFLQLLAFASGDRDRKLGLKMQSSTTSRYLCAAVRSINEQISDPRTCYADEMVGAISSAAYVEHYTGRKPAFNAHARALARILRYRKTHYLQVNPYVDAVTMSHLIAYCKAYVETLLDISSQILHTTSIESPEIQEMTDEVIQSTTLIQKLAFWRAERHDLRNRGCQSRDNAVAETKLRYRLQILFAPVSVLVLLLREPERMKSPIALVKEGEECYRFYAIFYLLLTLWDYRDDPQKCLDVFCNLQTALIDQKITTYTVSRVVWLLLNDHEEDAVRRRWTTLSMVKTLYAMGSEKDAMAEFLFDMLRDVALGNSIDVENVQIPSMTSCLFRLAALAAACCGYQEREG